MLPPGVPPIRIQCILGLMLVSCYSQPRGLKLSVPLLRFCTQLDYANKLLWHAIFTSNYFAVLRFLLLGCFFFLLPFSANVRFCLPKQPVLILRTFRLSYFLLPVTMAKLILSLNVLTVMFCLSGVLLWFSCFADAKCKLSTQTVNFLLIVGDLIVSM